MARNVNEGRRRILMYATEDGMSSDEASEEKIEQSCTLKTE